MKYIFIISMILSSLSCSGHRPVERIVQNTKMDILIPDADLEIDVKLPILTFDGEVNGVKGKILIDSGSNYLPLIEN